MKMVTTIIFPQMIEKGFFETPLVRRYLPTFSRLFSLTNNVKSAQFLKPPDWIFFYYESLFNT